MIPSLSNPFQRGALVTVSFVIGASLAYFSIRNAFAVHLAGLQTREGCERAIYLEPGDARNWHVLGRFWQYNLDNPDGPRAIRAYLAALSLNPGSADIWLDLATAYESEGNLAAARDAFLHARRAYPLSAEGSWRYGNFLLRQGDLDPAFIELRRAVESDPKRGAEAFSRSLHAGSSVETIVDRVLPPISSAYVDVIRDQIADRHTDVALSVWDRLASIRPRLLLQDSFPLVGALMTEKRIAQARRVWDQAVESSGMADIQGPSGSALWDGGFESGVTGGGFTWLFPDGLRGVQISIDTQEKHSGNRSLRLMFDGKSNINFASLCHYVPVQSSTTYRFSAWVRTRTLATDQGVRFQLHSLGTRDTSLSVTPDVHGTEPWTRIEIPWSSAKDVQELQVCLVRFPSDQPENKIQGTAWVDDVALVPEPAEHSKP